MTPTVTRQLPPNTNTPLPPTYPESPKTPPSQDHIQVAINNLRTGSKRAAQLMEQTLQDNPTRISMIERAIRQPHSLDTLQIAAVVLIQAMAIGQLPKRDLRKNLIARWQIYLDRYPNKPIIALAKDLLLALPGKKSQDVITLLARTAGLIRDQLTGNDLAGPVIQRLTANRKTIAAYHTTPESAALMAHLAIDPDQDWQSARIADFSAGTGILPMAVYRRIRAIHTERDHDPRTLHNNLMRTGITIADIMPASLAIASSNLGSIEPGKQIRYPRTLKLHHGIRQDPDGSRHIGLGALDLLIEIPKPTTKPGRPRLNTTSEPYNQQDLVIMNPPFTSQANIKGADQNIPSPELGIAPTTPTEIEQLTQATERAKHATGTTASCLAHQFAVLAQTFVRRNGTIALILPAQAITTASGGWQKFRKTLLQQFNDIRVVSITQYDEKDSCFSQDTGIAEIMVIARRTHQKESPTRQVNLISLNRRPQDAGEAGDIANAVRQTITRMSQAQHGANNTELLTIHQEEMGSITRTRIQNDADWPAPRVSQPGLATTASLVAQGILRDPEAPDHQQDITFPITTLDELGHVQPYNNIIERVFNKEEKLRSPRPDGRTLTLPFITGHRCDEQRTISTPSNIRRAPQTHMDRRAAAIHRRAGALHISDAFRYNSQSLQAIHTGEPSIAGRGWPGVRMRSERHEKIMSVWLNTTIANIIHWSRANHSHHGLGSIAHTKIKALPVLDITTLSSTQMDQMERIFDDFQHRTMRAANESWLDNARIELDRRVTQDVLNMRPAVRTQLDIIRSRWCLEPTVQGNKGKSKNHLEEIKLLTKTVRETNLTTDHPEPNLPEAPPVEIREKNAPPTGQILPPKPTSNNRRFPSARCRPKHNLGQNPTSTQVWDRRISIN